MHLDPAAAAASVRLIEREAVGSTNAEALAMMRTGERGPLWIVAHTQTAGRGRRGRVWASETGNLHATLLLTSPGQTAAVAELSFVAALAVHDAISEQAPGLAMRLSLKWPNDVLCDGKKFSGILLEGEGVAGGAATVAVGIGVNCGNHPEDTEYPATDLSASGAAVSPDMLFLSLSRTMMLRIQQWQDAGFPSVRADWLSRAEGLGRTIRVRLHNRDLTGTFEALDERGYLLLQLADGSREAIAAGDVFPLLSVVAGHP
jgi:BirA family biotin operon repressor/biotin-[acetyl-CoA-carboxylase] ligase